MNSSENIQQWWGSFTVALDESLLWEIAPLQLSVTRKLHEWQVAIHDHNNGRIEYDETRCRLTRDKTLAEDETSLSRYAFTDTEDSLKVTPRLADRPVIIKPAEPFHVPPGQTSTIYVSSPLWVQIEVHKAAIKLDEYPIQRPSDTWFGPSTREGELCYASRTHGRFLLEDLPLRPHRAITPVTIINQSTEVLHLERLSLPVAFLSLYNSDNGMLWTEGVTMLRKTDSDIAEITIADTAAADSGANTLVSGPRKKAEENMLMRAFGALLR